MVRKPQDIRGVQGQKVMGKNAPAESPSAAGVWLWSLPQGNSGLCSRQGRKHAKPGGHPGRPSCPFRP